MSEYRVQRLKEDLTYAQQRNKQQKKQLANYKKVHEKDLKEIEILNKGIEYAKRIEKDYKEKFDRAMQYIKTCKDNDMGVRYQRIEEILRGDK